MDDDRTLDIEMSKAAYRFMKNQAKFMKKCEKEAKEEKEQRKYSNAYLHYYTAMRAIKYYFCHIIFEEWNEELNEDEDE